MSEINAEVKWGLKDVALPTLDNPINPEVTPEQQMKLLYPNRPWESEPDYAEWVDPRTGYKCAIRRHETLGHLKGYVGVNRFHPAYGLNYEQANHCIDSDVHGGLTYAKTDENEVHWFGFDCGHAGDFSPGLALNMLRYYPEARPDWVLPSLMNETYRTWEFVETEIMCLVRLLSKTNVTWTE